MRKLKPLFISLLFAIPVFAQKQAPDNWFNLDRKSDKIWGVSTEKAYQELPVLKNSNKIIVAVIDAGTDINHEDLKQVLWVNTKEVAENGIDEDGNGYADDVNGWNFIGGKKGNVNEDTYEYTRILSSYPEPEEGKKPEFKTEEERVMYEKAEKLFNKNFKETNAQYLQYKEIMNVLYETIAKTGSKNPTIEQVDALPEITKEDKDMKRILKYIVKTGGTDNSPIMQQLKDAENQLATMVNFNLNKKFDPRDLVGDNYKNVNEHFYGNNQVNSPNMDHGTHVAGIIAANRNNEIGIKGICENAQIMTLRVVPNGDERDKDIANAIRYAADNGAKIINMSFGKKLSPNKQVVDEAVEYALTKDVLFVHAAGNDAVDLNNSEFYPMAKLLKKNEKVPNWIEVGASGWQKKKERVASFSNYGMNEVEIFAPGVDVYSTLPGSKYEAESGTSMAAPVVSGVAALVRKSYPQLTAIQTKQILMMSAVPCKEKVLIPGTKTKTKMAKLCVSGGIVNAYEALQLAAKVSSGEVKLP